MNNLNPYKPIQTLLGNRLLVEEIEIKTQGPIILLDREHGMFNQENYEAIVKKVGTGKDIPAEIKVGSRVLIRKSTGGLIDPDNTRLILTNLQHVLAVYE